MKQLFALLFILFFAIGAWSCENSVADPDQVTPDKVAPSGLAYSPNSYNIVVGQAGSSAIPTVSGLAPFTFELVSNAQPAISINATTGLISSTAALAKGSYPLSVKVTNSAGNATFNNVFTVNVSEANQPPTGLTYTKNSFTIRKHEALETEAPNVQGTPPFSFTIENSGSLPAGISINAASGIISLSKNIAHGNYAIDVKVTNAQGNQVKTSAVSIASVPVVFTGTIGVQALVQRKCTPCHVSGGANPTFTNYSNAKSRVGDIIIEVNAGSMPQGGPRLPTSEIDLIKQWQADGLKEN